MISQIQAFTYIDGENGCGFIKTEMLLNIYNNVNMYEQVTKYSCPNSWETVTL
jgi:hypothetical protein